MIVAHCRADLRAGRSLQHIGWIRAGSERFGYGSRPTVHIPQTLRPAGRVCELSELPRKCSRRYGCLKLIAIIASRRSKPTGARIGPGILRCESGKGEQMQGALSKFHTGAAQIEALSSPACSGERPVFQTRQEGGADLPTRPKSLTINDLGRGERGGDRTLDHMIKSHVLYH